MATSGTKDFVDVACTVCGCVCDDLEIRIDGERITRVRGACRLSEPWLLALNDCRPPAASIEGCAASWEEAIQRRSGFSARAATH
jgi:formylmethanofuran dehydrogenase subunit B